MPGINGKMNKIQAALGLVVLDYIEDENREIAAVFSYAQIIDEDGNDFSNENHLYKHIFIQPNRTRFEWLNYFF